MAYTFHYYSDEVQAGILMLPPTLKARYIALSLRMAHHGPNLGEPHTKAVGSGLFELRLKGAEGIARVFYCTQMGQRIMVLHSFIKKTDKTPLKEQRLAEFRLKEVNNANA